MSCKKKKSIILLFINQSEIETTPTEITVLTTEAQSVNEIITLTPSTTTVQATSTETPAKPTTTEQSSTPVIVVVDTERKVKSAKL